MSSFINSKKWYVFYTYPKFEKKVHEYLLDHNFESFLPLHWVIKQWSDRKKRLLVPLFPNYIFVNIERARIFEVLKTPKVISSVKFNNSPAFLRQNEVNSIIQIENNEYSYEMSRNLKVGDSVLIKEGTLTGMSGILVEERGNQRFALTIKSLQQSILINVPVEYLEFTQVFV